MNAGLFLPVHGCLPAIDAFQSGRAASQEQETLFPPAVFTGTIKRSLRQNPVSFKRIAS
jgi:hypothetical protein